jgi:hypothetical protein
MRHHCEWHSQYRPFTQNSTALTHLQEENECNQKRAQSFEIELAILPRQAQVSNHSRKPEMISVQISHLHGPKPRCKRLRERTIARRREPQPKELRCIAATATGIRFCW